MLCGLDELSGGAYAGLRRRMRGARLGVLTHAAAVDRTGRPALEVLEELGASPSIVFAPEHGLDSYAQALEAVSSAEAQPDAQRVVSLYGDSKASLEPNPDDLGQIDLLLIDLADVGARYYTYVWTALLAARAAHSAGVHSVILDRPNPISGDPATLEGVPQEADFLSFVGLEPLPVRHALTIGEILTHFAARDGWPLGTDGALSVVPTEGWERYRLADAWGRPFVMPSPNMPRLETALVYPGACLIEGTNLSEGRGTTVPFQVVGAPFLNGEALARALAEAGTPGAQVRPVSFRPWFDKFVGQTCHGVMIHVKNAALFRPMATYLTLIALAREQAPDDFAFRTEPYEFETEIPAFDLLTGSSKARLALLESRSPSEVVEVAAPVDTTLRDVVPEAEARLSQARAA